MNQEYAGFESGRELHDGDELAVFPPVSGGSAKVSEDDELERAPGETASEDQGNANTGTAGVSPSASSATDFFELTEDSIDVGAVARRVFYLNAAPR